jgi:hypothetical protein
MTNPAVPTASQISANETAAPDAADVGLLIFASIERIREQVKLEQACRRMAAPRMPGR